MTLLDELWSVQKHMINTAEPELSTFFITVILPSLPPANYTTHDATETLSDINLSDYMQLPLEPQMALYYLNNTTVLLKTYKHCNEYS